VKLNLKIKKADVYIHLKIYNSTQFQKFMECNVIVDQIFDFKFKLQFEEEDSKGYMRRSKDNSKGGEDFEFRYLKN
jgi:hypothetical protein